MLRSGWWPSVPGASRPSGLGPASEPRTPGQAWAVSCRALAAHWAGPGLGVAANLSPTPTSATKWRRTPRAQAQPIAGSLGPALQGLGEASAKSPLGVQRGRARRMAATRTPWRAVRASRAREGCHPWALEPCGFGTCGGRSVPVGRDLTSSGKRRTKAFTGPEGERSPINDGWNVSGPSLTLVLPRP